jgi:hypothetical protein
MNIYLELPEGEVPADLFDGNKAIVGITLCVRSGVGTESEVSMSGRLACGKRSRLYATNRPLEEIHAAQIAMSTEIMALRSSVATVASLFGLGHHIPVPGSGMRWEVLASQVVERTTLLGDHVASWLADLRGNRPARAGSKGVKRSRPPKGRA